MEPKSKPFLRVATKNRFKFNSGVVALAEDVLHLLPDSCKEKFVQRHKDPYDYFGYKIKSSQNFCAT